MTDGEGAGEEEKGSGVDVADPTIAAIGEAKASGEACEVAERVAVCVALRAKPVALG